MNDNQLTALLARIQVLDNRQIDQLTLEVWKPIVGDLDYDTAVEAVNAHFRANEGYLRPVHIVQGVKNISRAKRDQARQDWMGNGVEIPGILHPDQCEHRRWTVDGYCVGCYQHDPKRIEAA